MGGVISVLRIFSKRSLNQSLVMDLLNTNIPADQAANRRAKRSPTDKVAVPTSAKPSISKRVKLTLKEGEFSDVGVFLQRPTTSGINSVSWKRSFSATISP